MTWLIAGVVVVGSVAFSTLALVTDHPSAERGIEVEQTRAMPAGASCGVELWALKTLTDRDAGRVDLTFAPTTVAVIDALPLPADPSTRAGDAFELHAYAVTATLTGYRLEADSDLHLVLSDGGKTMIAEIPSPVCALGSRVLPQITMARAAFEAAHPQAAECFGCLSQRVTVWGVGFFDRPHGQNGVAPNAAELHPVLGFAVGGPPAPVTTTQQTTTTPAPAPVPVPDNGPGCKRWPHRHYLYGRYHAACRPYYFVTP